MAGPASPLDVSLHAYLASWLNAVEGFFAKLTRRRRADIDAIIESLAQPRAEFAAVVWPMRIGDDLETGLIMALEEFGHQKRRRVAAEIG